MGGNAFSSSLIPLVSSADQASAPHRVPNRAHIEQLALGHDAAPDGNTTTEHGKNEPLVDSYACDDKPLRITNPSRPGLPTRRRFWDKTGYGRLLLLTLGTLTMLGAICMLLFVWARAAQALQGRDPSRFWQDIVFSAWTTRVVTICAAVIRAIIALQAALITSLIAALFLESAGSTVHDLPTLSILRAFSPSPSSILMPALSGLIRRCGIAYSITIFATGFLTLASQFMSTILLSDFGDAMVAAPNVSAFLNTSSTQDIIRDDFSRGINYFSAPPASYWRFAEHKEPLAQNQLEAYADTGASIRAAIPWANQTHRLALGSYSGPAQAWDARVICFSPTVLNVSLTTYRVKNGTADTQVTMRGNFTYDGSYPQIKPERSGPAFAFECQLDDYSLFESEKVAVCNAKPSSTVYFDTPLFPEQASDTLVMIVVRWNVELRSLSPPLGNISLAGNQSAGGLSFRQEGPWTALSRDSDSQSLLSLSACISNGLVGNFNITMSGSPLTSEPVLSYDMGPQGTAWAGSINASQPRRQLGAMLETLSLEDRGILSLNPQRALEEGTWRGYRCGMCYLREAGTIMLSQGQALTGYTQAHNTHGALFIETLNATANAALAVQALSTVLNQMQYFDNSYRFDWKASVSYTMYEKVLIPVRWNGLFGVITMVAVHLFMVIITIVLFLSRTKESLIGNAWQSVAQVVSDQTMELVLRADRKKDKELKGDISRSRWDSTSIGVIRQRRNGRAEFGPL